MLEQHPTLGEIGELLDSEVTPSHVGWIADHLFRCPECWDKATDTISKLDASGYLGKSSAAIKAIVQRFKLEQSRLEEELLAQAAVGSLRSLNRKNQRELLAKRPEYRSRAVVEELVAEAKRAAAPQEGEEWANLALTACYQLSSSEFSEALRADLLAQAYAELASARRRSARWNAAKEALKEGFSHARRGSKSGTIEGLLLMVEGVQWKTVGGDALATKESSI